MNYIGNTPLIKLRNEDIGFDINLYAKLEGFNPYGSVKDRAAYYIINKLLDTKIINKNYTIIESSSGNMGVALSGICKDFGIPFTCVVDPYLTSINEMLLKNFSANIVKVTKPDNSGGYLLSRIETVQDLLKKNKNAYWTNQYSNIYNAEAHFYGLGSEITNSFKELDFIFVPVSSGGTITGVSKKVKEKFPNAKIIAVDVIGSVIFGKNPGKRFIPGMGSSMQPTILKEAKIDWVVWIDEKSTIKGCYKLLKEYSIFAGGSSGTTYMAIYNFFNFIENLFKCESILKKINKFDDIRFLTKNEILKINKLIKIIDNIEYWEDKKQNWYDLIKNRDSVNNYWEARKGQKVKLLKEWLIKFLYIKNKKLNIVFICPDRGEKYYNTIYTPIWCEENIYNNIKK